MTAKVALKRIRRTIAVALYAALASGFVWLVITRWNGVPADPGGADIVVGSLPQLPIDPKWDRTEDLVAALAALPLLPKLILKPPPPNMRWNNVNSAGGLISLSEVLCGEWTPDSRPNLQGVIAYLNAPAVKLAMEKITVIEPGGFRMTRATLWPMQKAVMRFVARARFRHASYGDIDGALTDLETVYRLVSISSHSGNETQFAVAFACKNVADAELRKMAHEHSMTRSQAARFLEIARTTMPDKKELWRRITASRCDVLGRLIDMSYTDDGLGNGWLVLSHMGRVTRATWTPTARSGAWNLLSPLFNDRRTVASRLGRFREAFEKVGELPYLEAEAAAQAAEQCALSLTVLDGPLGSADAGSYVSLCLNSTLGHITRSNATIVAVALSAYRHDYGEYPGSLETLLPDYLNFLPLDPFVDQPLRYLRQEGGKNYVLYAVGPNQKDDCGTYATKVAWIRPSERDDDKVIWHVRSETSWEPKLETVNP